MGESTEDKKIRKSRWPHLRQLLKQQHKRFKHAMKRSRRVKESCDTFITRDDER